MTSIAQNNLRSSGQQRAKERDSQTDYGMPAAELHSRLSAEKESISVCSSSERCNGVMGVPITFLDKYNPDQFEILDARDFGKSDRQRKKSTLLVKDGDGTINGKATYARVLIKRRKFNEN